MCYGHKSSPHMGRGASVVKFATEYDNLLLTIFNVSVIPCSSR